MVKNLPAKQQTWVQLLGLEDSLEKGIAPTPIFLPGELFGQKSLAGYSPWCHRRVEHNLVTKQYQI